MDKEKRDFLNTLRMIDPGQSIFTNHSLSEEKIEEMIENGVNNYDWYGNRIDGLNNQSVGVKDEELEEDAFRVKKRYEEIKETWRKGGIVKFGKKHPKKKKTHLEGAENTKPGATSHILNEIKMNEPNTENQRSTESQSSNPNTDDDSPALWTLENKEQFQRFELKNVNYRELHSTLTDNSSGIINNEITLSYFVDIVQRAQFGKIYNHCDTKKTKFRIVVHLLSKHTNTKEKRKEYLEVAASSMQIINKKGELNTKQFGQFNVKKKDSFRIKVEKIL